MARTLTAVASGIVLSLLASGSAQAAHHLIKVVEVFRGATAAPNAQFVVLQMYSGGQNLTNGTSIAVYNAVEVEIGRFTFVGNVSNSFDQSKILIATTQAATFFAVSANLTMTAVLPEAGGKVCFESPGFGVLDCLAWGSYTGNPAGVGPPFSPTVGLFPPGRSALRRLDIAGSPTALDGADDTNNSANDFRFGTPAPRNNANQNGTIPASTCGNDAIEGLESCDDGNTMSGDGCTATCIIEFCGNNVTEGPEQCDDGNRFDGDGCSATCEIERLPLILADGFEDPLPP
jgi:cysteine-rich repeat protein